MRSMRNTKKFLSTCWGRAGVSLHLVLKRVTAPLAAPVHVGRAVRERRT